jgi:hypothetical protein
VVEPAPSMEKNRTAVLSWRCGVRFDALTGVADAVAQPGTGGVVREGEGASLGAGTVA